MVVYLVKRIEEEGSERGLYPACLELVSISTRLSVLTWLNVILAVLGFGW